MEYLWLQASVEALLHHWLRGGDGSDLTRVLDAEEMAKQA